MTENKTSVITMGCESSTNSTFIPDYIDSVEISYFIDKIKYYLSVEKRNPEEIYNFITNLFSADVFTSNIFKKHPIDHKINSDIPTISNYLQVINTNMNWIVFVKYNIIICMNDAMVSYIYPLREIMKQSSSFETTQNIIRLPYIGFDNTKNIGPRLFITESPLAMFEYFPSDYEPTHFNYYKKNPMPYRTIKYIIESNSENETIRKPCDNETNINHFDYEIVNNESKSPFRDNNLLESLNYYHKCD
jgi:hypothetical protein